MSVIISTSFIFAQEEVEYEQYSRSLNARLVYANTSIITIDNESLGIRILHYHTDKYKLSSKIIFQWIKYSFEGDEIISQLELDQTELKDGGLIWHIEIDSFKTIDNVAIAKISGYDMLNRTQEKFIVEIDKIGSYKLTEPDEK